MRRLSLEDIKEKSESIHGKDKFEFIEIFYKNGRKYLKSKCKKCGHELEQSVTHHYDRKCPHCNKMTFEKAVQKSKEKHGDKYEYIDFYYENGTNWIKVKCLDCGDIRTQRFSCHIKGDCRNCINIRYCNPIENIKERLKKYDGILIFNNLENEYKNSKSVVSTTCCKCGFENKIMITNYVNKYVGCSRCAGKAKLSLNEVEKRSTSIHGLNRYKYHSIYTKKQNKRYDTYLKIECQECDNIFDQSLAHHINRKRGCPKCNRSKGENIIDMKLKNMCIEYIPQKRFEDCRCKKPLPFDFYLPEYNICIEYDGKQHYESIERFGGEEELKERIKRDNIKTEYCKNNNIELLRIRYDEDIKNKIENALQRIKV